MYRGVGDEGSGGGEGGGGGVGGGAWFLGGLHEPLARWIAFFNARSERVGGDGAI